MSSSTTVTQAPPSKEEKAYLQSQQQLAAKQLEIINQQQGFNADYMTSIKPLMEQQSTLNQQLLDQQTAALNDPVTKEIQQKANDLLTSQIQNQNDLAPLQKQLLQSQVDQAIHGNAPTPEQIANIDAATKAAYQTGTSDISAFSDQALTQLGQELAPSLGLRPSDTPILDRGALVQREATRQAGQLASSLAGVNAQARLNYPLASQQLSSAISGNAANISQATQQFQAALADAAANNRIQLLNSGSNSFGLGLNAGSNLAGASRANPLSFTRSSTTTKDDPLGSISAILGGVGGLTAGLGTLGPAASAASFLLSDRRAKDNVSTIGRDRKGRRWVHFTYKGDPARIRHTGVIAQEVERTDPEAVLTNGLGLKFVDYSKLKQAA